jgi:hypothetical protein
LSSYSVFRTRESNEILFGWDDQDARGYVRRKILERGLGGRPTINPHPHLHLEVTLNLAEEPRGIYELAMNVILVNGAGHLNDESTLLTSDLTVFVRVHGFAPPGHERLWRGSSQRDAG